MAQTRLVAQGNEGEAQEREEKHCQASQTTAKVAEHRAMLVRALGAGKVVGIDFAYWVLVKPRSKRQSGPRAAR